MMVVSRLITRCLAVNVWFGIDTLIAGMLVVQRD